MVPEPTSSSSARKAATAVDPTGALEALAKGILLTADRIQEAMDDAVRRGRMTRDDAEDLARLLIETGRKQTEELLRDVESLVARASDVAGAARRKAGG
jgi:polyhydroxyalkanoate synthesis regulator phasin